MHAHDGTGELVKSNASTHIVKEQFVPAKHRDIASSNADNEFNRATDEENIGQTPESFTGRIIFMSMFNDISWGSRDNRRECESKRTSSLSSHEWAPSTVKATPQMTRFCDAKVCNNWLQIGNDDHRIQSDYKYKSELQKSRRKEICIWYCVCVVKTHDTNDNVITKTQNTFNTTHMNTYT